jgi:hypothetical protein
MKKYTIFIFLTTLWTFFGFYIADFLGVLNKNVVLIFLVAFILNFIGYSIITKSLKFKINGKRY